MWDVVVGFCVWGGQEVTIDKVDGGERKRRVRRCGLQTRAQCVTRSVFLEELLTYLDDR